jgi:hypothetical protein
VTAPALTLARGASGDEGWQGIAEPMDERIVVFEMPTRRDVPAIRRCLRRSDHVSVVERFHAYHYMGRYRFFPPAVPPEVEAWVERGNVEVLSAEWLGASDIYWLAGDKAVGAIERVFSYFKERHRAMIDFVTRALGSQEAEDIFRKDLCDKLATFFSANLVLGKISRRFPDRLVTVHTPVDLRLYEFLRLLLLQAGVEVSSHDNVRFPWRLSVRAWMQDRWLKGRALGQIGVEGLLGLVDRLRRKPAAPKQSFRYGVAIVSPARQFLLNQRGPGFLVDGETIRPEEVVYIPLNPPTEEQESRLRELKGGIYHPPTDLGIVHRVASMARLLGIALGTGGASAGLWINRAYTALLVYARWKRAAEELFVRHFITHADFHPMHVVRGIALKQAGTETWYFADSMNSEANFLGCIDGCRNRHPQWSYLYYDHHLTWHSQFADWLKEFPGPSPDRRVIGCLWSQHVRTPVDRDALLRSILLPGKEARGKFLVVAYTSGYSIKAVISYDEGIAFARQLGRLAREVPGVFILIKEKKRPEFHVEVAGRQGAELLAVYDELNRLDNAQVLSLEAADTSALMAVGDLIVSFPFSSPTFEALGVRKAAFWHDPFGLYRYSAYAKAGVVTHGYDELKAEVLRIRAAGADGFKDPFPPGSPLMDPYRDGRAIDRFRQLLLADRGPAGQAGGAAGGREPQASEAT